jgi:hypothetical protein
MALEEAELADEEAVRARRRLEVGGGEEGNALDVFDGLAAD